MDEGKRLRAGVLLCVAAVVVVGSSFLILPRELPTLLEVLIQFAGITLAGLGLGALLGRRKERD